MKKALIILFTIIVIIALGVSFYLYQTKTRVDRQEVMLFEQKISQEELGKRLLQASVSKVSGTFNEIDVVHKGEGTAAIYETTSVPVLRLEDFSVTNGPDLYVYLSEKHPTKQFDDLGEFVSLGVLISPEGEQLYTLPENYADYSSVVIWCKAFGVLFSSAELN